MPIPSKKGKEEKNKFMGRCMSDTKMKEEYPDRKQRTAICISKACEGIDYVESADFQFTYEAFGFEEEVDESNFVVPKKEDYVDFSEDEEEWKFAISKEFKYQDPKTGEIFTYNRRGIYKKNGRVLIPVRASEYQGKAVKLNKPFRTPNGPKKMSVYVKNAKGNVVKVNFEPERRKSFKVCHNCDNPGPRWKARYWSCKAW
tara:strand:- start:706 stop:1308 length:603 start_codon:yes stop_codon:yes gene_type:complete